MVKWMKNCSPHFDIFNFLQCCHHSTRSSSSFKLRHSLYKKTIPRAISTSTESPDYGTPFHPWASIVLSQSSSLYYVTTFGKTLSPISIHTIFVLTTICVLVVAALNSRYVCYSLSGFVVCVMCLVSFIWVLAKCLQTIYTDILNPILHSPYSFHLLCCKVIIIIISGKIISMK